MKSITIVIFATLAACLSGCSHSLPAPTAETCSQKALAAMPTNDMVKMATACQIRQGAIDAKIKRDAAALVPNPASMPTHGTYNSKLGISN